MFFKERRDEGMLDLEYVASVDQAADVLTKGLFNPLLQHAVSKLGMDDIHTSLAGVVSEIYLIWANGPCSISPLALLSFSLL